MYKYIYINKFVYIYMYIYIHMYIYIYTYMYICVCACVSVYILWSYMYVCMCVCLYTYYEHICMYARVCVCCTYPCTYVDPFIHTQIYGVHTKSAVYSRMIRALPHRCRPSINASLGYSGLDPKYLRVWLHWVFWDLPAKVFSCLFQTGPQ